MLLEIAEAATSLGHEVHVVGPDTEDGVLAAAAQRGLEVTALSPERRDYMRQLREWDRRRDGVLWCNGLVPAVATTGRGNRIVHLHQATRAELSGTQSCWARFSGCSSSIKIQSTGYTC